MNSRSANITLIGACSIIERHAGGFRPALGHRRHVAGKLDHFHQLAAGVGNRIVRSLDDDLLAALADSAIFARQVFAAVEPRPELAILVRIPLAVFDEHAVMTAFDLVQRIAERLQEVVVGGDDRAVHLELDHRLRLADRREHVVQFDQPVFLGGIAWTGLGLRTAVAMEWLSKRLVCDWKNAGGQRLSRATSTGKARFCRSTRIAFGQSPSRVQDEQQPIG